MRLRISIRGRVRLSFSPSVGLFVRLLVPCYFRTSKNDISEAPMTTKFNKKILSKSSKCKNNDNNNNMIDILNNIDHEQMNKKCTT